ncbi:MAG: deaminase [Nanoarchaeota archaeon]
MIRNWFYWIARTKEIASYSKYYIVGRRTGCVLVRKNKLISKGFNKLKNRKGLKGHTSVHSEIDALNKANGKTIGSIAYIFRINGGHSRPCRDCWDHLIQNGIKEIYYENEFGAIVKWKK